MKKSLKNKHLLIILWIVFEIAMWQASDTSEPLTFIKGVFFPGAGLVAGIFGLLAFIQYLVENKDDNIFN